jgi:hypothetical protein
MIHVGGLGELAPIVFAAAAGNSQLALALSLLRLGQQASRSEFRIFHYVQALEVLASATRGGSISVQLRRYLVSVGVTPAASPADPRRDFADVLADLRNTVAHGKPLDATAVQPYSVPYPRRAGARAPRPRFHARGHRSRGGPFLSTVATPLWRSSRLYSGARRIYAERLKPRDCEDDLGGGDRVLSRFGGGEVGADLATVVVGEEHVGDLPDSESIEDALARRQVGERLAAEGVDVVRPWTMKACWGISLASTVTPIERPVRLASAPARI